MPADARPEPGLSAPGVRWCVYDVPRHLSSMSRDITGVREGGFEPPRPFGHRILSPARLPVPPLSHTTAQGGLGAAGRTKENRDAAHA